MTTPRQLRIFFMPFMSYGHLIPTIDLAILFAGKGVKATIITTPVNAPQISKVTERARNSGHEIQLLVTNFPSVEAGLPEGCESFDQAPSPDMQFKFFKATTMLKEPLAHLLQTHRPDCIVADMFFPWVTEVAAAFGIPRIVFHGTCIFSISATEHIRLYKPHKEASSDSEPFVLPDFPGNIKLTKSQLPDFVKQETWFTELYNEGKETELKSFGVIVNSFYQLESAYVDHYTKVLERRAWLVGPISLCNRGTIDITERGKKASISENECLTWLNSKKPNSVVYISFGSVANFNSAQLLEIAAGLEASGQHFIWVVRKGKKKEEEKEDWFPEGFEERMEGKGLIIRGWAPQVLILDHEAIGGFVTHCGWNSTLESVCAGVPVVAWPVASEQYYNEKLLTQVLRIGIPVGAQKWARLVGDFVKREAIEKAVKEIMVGDRAEEIRSRAKEFAEMARKAVENGGSSYSDLNALLEELRSTIDS
ncbi:UDP-glucuronosyl/UDP-glucosyltransferase [Corchorus capsularis]|uniref:Glycosyltransferase n=1 Tax=Corchorus capsularis TaxID=210143 RepID=A0A1R3HUQ0_COCAP|nr:UDP-glucuronosyl/UDP-glucosyltransferase [Corchorus capsularis]